MSQYSESTKRALLSCPITDVLAALGKHVDKPSRRGFYFSPLREEKHPSFQINATANVWTDWGTGEKGGVIDLICRLKACTRSEALDFLASIVPSATLQYENVPARNVHGDRFLVMDEAGPLRSPALFRYAGSRGIPADLVSRFCEEAKFNFVGSNLRMFSIGFRNNSGGYALRNAMKSRWSKVSMAPMDITTFDSSLMPTPEPSSSSVLVLEGFFDFLSLLVMVPSPGMDVCVLNSGSMLGVSKAYLSAHGKVYGLLDNDAAGDIYMDRMRRLLPDSECVDCRGRYSEYNDLNDLLLGRSGVRKPSAF